MKTDGRCGEVRFFSLTPNRVITRRRVFRGFAGRPRPYEKSPAGENVSVHHFLGQINDNIIMLSKTSSNTVGCPWNSTRTKYVVYSENRVFLVPGTR